MSSSQSRLQVSALLLALLACAVTQAAPPAGKAAATQVEKSAKKPATPQDISPCNNVERGLDVRLAVGKSALIRPPIPVARLLVGNPQNTEAARPSEAKGDDGKPALMAMPVKSRSGVAELDVLLLSPSEMYLLGKTVGTTNIVLLDRSGRCSMFDVIVGMDTAALKASLRELLPAETDLRVSSAGESLVLSGVVSDAGAVDRVMDIAGAFVGGTQGASGSANPRIINMLEVGAPQQVMLEVKVAEISKALLDEFGINFSRAYATADGTMARFLSGIFGGNGMLSGQVAGATGASVGFGLVGSMQNGSFTAANTVPAGSASIGGTTTTVPIISGKNMTTLGVDAQKQDALVKILAEPTVMAISGQEGSFLAGGKIFIPVSTNNGNGGLSITLEEKEFGVSLKFTPTVLSGGRINLKVSPEVSELNPKGVAISAASVAGTTILPAFTTRRAMTTVQLKDGQSFAIGGLIKNNVTSSITAFPFLGELPVIGALFRSTSFQNDRSELVFVVTPRLVQPLPPDYPLPTDSYVQPSRYDMIMSGKLEGPPRSKDTPAPDSAAQATAPAQGGGFEVK